MITKRKISDLLSISPNLFCKEMYRDQFGEFVCGYWGLKGLKPQYQHPYSPHCSSYISYVTARENLGSI